MGQAPRELTPSLSALHFFGAELRHWRTTRGLSQDALGQLTHDSGALISKIEKAARRPTDRLARQCDEILNTGGVLQRLLPLIEQEATDQEPGPRQHHTHRPQQTDDQQQHTTLQRSLNDIGQPTPNPLAAPPLLNPASPEFDNSLGDHTAEWPPTKWLQLLDAMTLAASKDGLAELYPIALKQLRQVTAIRQTEPHQRTAVAALEARWSEFMSWLCDNRGLPDGAQWLSHAYARAIEANQPHLAAYVLMRTSQHALDGNDPRTAISFARRTLDDASLPPKTHALCLARLAEALALTGDDMSLVLASTAKREVSTAGEHPDDAPARHCDARYVDAIQARCHLLLGEHRTAAGILEQVLANPTPAAPVDTGMWLTYLADSYRPTDPELAGCTGRHALSIGTRHGSVRIVRALLPLAVGLRGHRALEPIGQFLAAHREALVNDLTR